MEDTEQVVLEGKMEEEDPENPKSPRRIIHFSSGETMEEYSTEEEEELKENQRVDTSKLSWGPYLQFWAQRVVTASFFTCDFLGGKLASLFGLTWSKYQYAVDEYSRRRAEGCEDEDSHDIELSEIPQRKTEKLPLEAQGPEYGSIPLTDRPVLPLTSSVITIDETVGPASEYQSLSLNDTD